MSSLTPSGVLPPPETNTIIEFRAPPPSPVASGRTIFDSRAPPPSPVASGRRSSFVNEDVLSEFLEHSLKVPDLILPDRVFPRQKSVQNIPKLDFEGLSTLKNEAIMKFIDSVSRTGCFEVFNHGVPLDLIKSALDAGNGVFGISPEKKKIMTTSTEKPYGFEDFHGEEEQEKDINEEFIWCKDETLKNEMEKILPLAYSNFSEKMEKLVSMMESMAEKILQLLEQNTYSSVTSNWEEVKKEDHHHQEFSSICCLQKHNNWQVMMNGDQSESSLRYDVIRMLVRGAEFPHALCVHVFNGAQEFHVYSKKGWVSFHPDQDSLIITIGDHLKVKKNFYQLQILINKYL
ncbi:OLC1v1014872C1 [Oldenlandia corymbosa var. corymbosa]|uniref:OLC1v1014872C1 n=1 Tax=Oldenlandia corymbosa var. corymbosa TaxID=529605 RepID=A0AAV1E5L4_OLDCO|nr:OLC1v1014872C1 [Oldenlandia corymbosa var. corymbosa]